MQRTTSPFLAGLLATAVPLLWPGLLGLIPRFVLGGLLLFSGLGTLRQWVLRSRRGLSRSEYAIVLAVLAITARFGLITGAFAGLLLGCAFFVVIYSRTSQIRASYRGAAARSRVDRTEAEEDVLAAHADTVLVLHLQGFVFFGTASLLADTIRAAIAATPGRLRHVVLECANVQGIDGSALASLERILRLAAAEHIALVFAALSPSVAARLSTLGVAPRFAPTLDDALEWREAAVLASSIVTPCSAASTLAQEFDCPNAAAAFLGSLEAEDIAAGQPIVSQGDLSDDLLFFERGRATVSSTVRPGATPIRLNTVAAGAMIGEIGFWLGLPRTATVIAEEPCRVLRLTRAGLARMEADHPAAALAFHRLVVRRLGKRLLNKDQMIVALVRDRA